MSQLTLTFREASQYLSDHSYLTVEDAESQLKLMYHVARFTQSIKRAPSPDEILKMAEYVKTDKALAYRTLEFPVSMVNQLIRTTEKVHPLNPDYET